MSGRVAAEQVLRVLADFQTAAFHFLTESAAQLRGGPAAFSSDVSACMGVTETGRPSSSTATMVK